MQENKRTSDSFFDKNSFFILLLGIMLGGVLIGSLAFCNMNENAIKKMSFIAQGFVETRTGQGFLSILLKSFISSSIPVLIIFLLGFSAVTQPFEFLIPFLKGLGLGASLAQIYQTSGIKGSLIILFLIIPYVIINTFGLIVATREAIRFSNIIAAKAFSSSNSDSLKNITKLYCEKFVIIEVIMVFAAFVDSICSFVFAGVLLK